MGRIAGRLLMAIGVIHCALFLWWGRRVLVAIWQDGFFNTIDPHKDRQMIFWSLCFGVVAIFLGRLISWLEAQGKRTPAFLGWELLALFVVGGMLMPYSGGWLALVPAVLIILGSRRNRTAPHESHSGAS